MTDFALFVVKRKPHAMRGEKEEVEALRRKTSNDKM